MTAGTDAGDSPTHALSRVARLRWLLPAVAIALAGCTGHSVRVTEPATQPASATVVLLHGYARGPGSMRRVATALSERGFRVCSVGYDSFPTTVDELLPRLQQDLETCGGDGPRHFVTHSFGGILLRAHALSAGEDKVGRAVMLAPPNHGSELSDIITSTPLLRPLLGPVVTALGTGPASLPNRLGPAGFSVGIIAGTRALHPVGKFVLNGPSDGTVTVQSARLSGMDDFAVVNRAHSFIMNDKAVIAEIGHFLERGCFSGTDATVVYGQDGRCAAARGGPGL